MNLLTRTARVFFNHFQEVICYRSASNPNIDREIKANVIRRSPSVFQQSGRVTGQVIEIDVRNLACSMHEDPDGIGGVSAEELNTGGDQFVLALRAGDTTRTARPIKRILNQDEAIIQVEVG